MNPFRFQRKDGSGSIAAQTTAGAAILLVALLAYLSANPEAHERFHHDAGQEDHHCVITEFAAGQAFFLAPEIEIRPAEEILFEIAHAEAKEFLREPVDYVLLPICGPPFNGQTV